MMLPLNLLMLVLAAVPSCQAGAVAAWMTGIGPQIMLQNSTTGLLRYSACNSYNMPVFTYEDDNVFSTTMLPRNGTALAGVGWWTNTQTIASVFYQDVDNQLINLYAACNMTTGQFITSGSYVISGNAPSVNNNTGLAAVLLGQTGGYRVYYQDDNNLVNEISYTTDDGWSWRDTVSNDPQASFAIAATFTGTDNITVVTARDGQNVEVSQWNTDDSWHISTFPQPLNGPGPITSNTSASSISINTTTTTTTDTSLPGWADQAGLGLSVDSGSSTRSVWYIGNDSALHQVSSNPTNQAGAWIVQSPQNTSVWPSADAAEAPLGVVAGTSTAASSVYIYYVVDGLVTQVSFEDGSWQAFAALPTVNTSTATSTPTAGASSTSAAPSGSTSSSSGASSGSGGLSSGAQAGIGVGVTLAVLAVAGALVAVCIFRRRSQRNKLASASASAAAANGFDATQPQFLDGEPKGNYYYGAGSAPSSQQPSPLPAYGTVWEQNQAHAMQGGGVPAGGVPTPMELSGVPRPVFELAEQNFNAELPTDVR